MITSVVLSIISSFRFHFFESKGMRKTDIGAGDQFTVFLVNHFKPPANLASPAYFIL